MIKREKVQTVKNFINTAHTASMSRHDCFAAVVILCTSLGMDGKTVDAWTDAVNTKWNA